MIDLPSCHKKWVWSLIFIRIPINADQIIYDHLGDLNLIRKKEKLFESEIKNKEYSEPFSATFAKPNDISIVLTGVLRNYLSFAVIRNPWERAFYMHDFLFKKEKTQLNFNEFCEFMMDKYEKKDSKFLPIHDQCSWLEGVFEPNFILRFENLNKDFSNMLDICQIKHINKNLPHENSTERKPYKEYYNDQSIKIIEKIFERDIDKFKYSY